MKKLAYIIILVSLVLGLSQGISMIQSALAAPSWITLTKTPNPPQVYEPGGLVEFTVTMTSWWNNPLTITSIVDDVHGDLNGQGTCSVPQTIQPGETYTCTFTAMVTGNPGYSETDRVSVSGTDSTGAPFYDSATATVDVLDLPPSIVVTKTADPTQVNEPGGPVNFTVVVENTSGIADPVTITSLTDSIHGDLNGQGTCSVPQIIQPGDSYTCTFTATVSGNAGYSETDVVTASGTDDEGNPVSGSDDATVTVVAKLFKVYFPVLSSDINNTWNVSVGYEDLPFGSPLMDFDYNDLVVSIKGNLTFNQEIKTNLEKVNFAMIPEARGAEYDHEFHMFFPANIFGSDGTATLTIFDQNHNVFSTQSMPFIASADTNILIFPKTSDIYPPMSNTYETQPHLLPQRTATLTIVFDTPFYFNLSAFVPKNEHGVGMFFDPYIKVINSGEQISAGDSRMLVILNSSWMWPEEHIRIDNVYPDTVYNPGPPPDVLFPPNWWLNYNTCVYGDGIPCPTQ